MTQTLSSIDPASEIERVSAILRRDGYCIISDLLPAEEIAALDRTVSARFERTPFSQGVFYGERTKRFGRLLLRAPATSRLAQCPLLLGVARKVLEANCDTIQLNVMQAIEIHPGELAQFPHRDEDMWQGDKGKIEYLLNVIWPLTPFKADNGATVVWPGSHCFTQGQEESDLPGIAALCEPGGAILFLGSTLHGGGANRSLHPRRGIVVGYSLGWLKPYENPWLTYPPDIARDFTSDLAALLGYCQHRPNLGNVDGQCPSRLLSGPFPSHVAAVDALRPDQEAAVSAHVAQERARQMRTNRP